jgi:hypothetical protein
MRSGAFAARPDEEGILSSRRIKEVNWGSGLVASLSELLSAKFSLRTFLCKLGETSLRSLWSTAFDFPEQRQKTLTTKVAKKRRQGRTAVRRR